MVSRVRSLEKRSRTWETRIWKDHVHGYFNHQEGRPTVSQGSDRGGCRWLRQCSWHSNPGVLQKRKGESRSGDVKRNKAIIYPTRRLNVRSTGDRKLPFAKAAGIWRISFQAMKWSISKKFAVYLRYFFALCRLPCPWLIKVFKSDDSEAKRQNVLNVCLVKKGIILAYSKCENLLILNCAYCIWLQRQEI